MKKEIGTHVEVTQETSDDDDIVLEKLVERGHVDLFSEEHVVREILNDFSDNHKPSSHSRLVFLWYFDVDRFWRHDRRGNEPEEHESPKGGELRVRPDFIPTRV
jgi:hypothetical protein